MQAFQDESFNLCAIQPLPRFLPLGTRVPAKKEGRQSWEVGSPKEDVVIMLPSVPPENLSLSDSHRPTSIPLSYQMTFDLINLNSYRNSLPASTF